MTPDPRDLIDELLERAEELDEGAGQIALVEEAVRVADSHRDPEAGFLTRRALTRAATFGGRPDLAVVSFSWCLAHADRDPDNIDWHDLLWQYKWVTQNVGAIPSVSQPQIEALLDDMTVRFAGQGSTLHALHMIRRDVAVEMCDRAAAEAAHATFSTLRRDDLSDCPACVNDGTIEYHLFLGDDAAAVATARPALEGKMRCGEVPHRTYSYVLLPLLRLGKADRAARYYKAGYKLVRTNEKFVRHKGYHLAFLALTGNLDRAARLFERHLGEAARTTSQSGRFEFYLAARLFLDRVPATTVLRVPEEARVGDSPTRPGAEIVGWLDEQVAGLAAAFDARNGNDGFTRRIAWFRDQARYATDCPIGG